MSLISHLVRYVLNLLTFLNGKIGEIQSKIVTPDFCIDAPCPTFAILSGFMTISWNKLMITAVHFKRSSCPVDIMSAKNLCDVLDGTAPCLLSIIKSLLSSGCVPEYLKTAWVQPLIKKYGLDPSECSNYRAISKLPFIAKPLRSWSPYKSSKRDKKTFMKCFSQVLDSITVLRLCLLE